MIVSGARRFGLGLCELVVVRVALVRRRRFAAICALAAIAVLLTAAQSALAMTPLDGEGVSGTATSTGGASGALSRCPLYPNETMGFSASGRATGPYPGQFTETGSAWVRTTGLDRILHSRGVSATFTITSGSTTVTGSFSGGDASSSGVICNSAGGVAGLRVSGLGVSYTATVNGQTVRGTGTVSGTFYAAAGAHGSVSLSITTTYGQITGTVVDSTSAPLGGICVTAYTSSGAALDSTQTDSSGAYTLSSVPDGSAEVGFSSGCGTTNYLQQYYNGKQSLASADAVSVTAGATTSGINATMVEGGQITGTVTDNSASHTALADICERAYDDSGSVVASAQTDSNGSYTLSALPTGSYRVGFSDCSYYPYWATQYYKDKATLASATPVTVTDGNTTSGINAAVVPEGHISGTVTDITSHTGAFVCIDIWNSSGNLVNSFQPNLPSGTYTTPPLAAGAYRVEFQDCNSVGYADQYYKDKTTLASATPVMVTDGNTTSGIDAVMAGPGKITGTVTDSATHAPLADICVRAYNNAGSLEAKTHTNLSGAYTLSGVLSGTAEVGFSPGCPRASNYLPQYYSGQSSLASADPVSVTVGATTPGINAAMVAGGQIRGTVRARGTRAPLAGICVRAFNRSGILVASAQTNSKGTYRISALPTRSYRVGFIDCSHKGYLRQYYKDKTSLASADPVSVTVGTTTRAINAAMQARP